MDIVVGINSGRIEMRRARREGAELFETDAEAAQALAHHVAQMARRYEFAPSCSNPAAFGRPSFSLPAFQRLLATEMRKFGVTQVGSIAA